MGGKGEEKETARAIHLHSENHCTGVSACACMVHACRSEGHATETAA